MNSQAIETDGFVRVIGMPDLSYSAPELRIYRSLIAISRNRSAQRGIFRAGPTLDVRAISRTWILDALGKAHSSITIAGNDIADIRDPDSDKDGYGINAIDHLTLALTATKRATFHIEGLIGGPTFGGGISQVAGRAVQVSFELDRDILREALIRAVW